jgi:hypothetical protein
MWTLQIQGDESFRDSSHAIVRADVGVAGIEGDPADTPGLERGEQLGGSSSDRNAVETIRRAVSPNRDGCRRPLYRRVVRYSLAPKCLPLRQVFAR